MDGAATQPLIRGGDDDSKAPVRWQPIVKSSLFGSDTFDNPFPEWKAVGGLPGPSATAKAVPMMLMNSEKRLPPPGELDRLVPVVAPQFGEFLAKDKLRVHWMGHASVLVQLEGATILTDPIFSSRCSPVQWAGGAKRFRPPPCEVRDLPPLDAVLISHNHFDHLDSNSVRDLLARDPDLKFFVPLGLGAWLRGAGAREVHELGWWEERELAAASGARVKITGVPAMHWSNRGLDKCQSLWCGFALEGLGFGKKFYFAGDTGYTVAFKDVGAILGPFDAAAIPIGAYDPEWFLKVQHTNPEEGVQMHVDVGSKASFGIHWGTFQLSMEPVGEPAERWLKEGRRRGIGEEVFTLAIGGSRTI